MLRQIRTAFHRSRLRSLEKQIAQCDRDIERAARDPNYQPFVEASHVKAHYMAQRDRVLAKLNGAPEPGYWGRFLFILLLGAAFVVLAVFLQLGVCQGSFPIPCRG